MEMKFHLPTSAMGFRASYIGIMILPILAVATALSQVGGSQATKPAGNPASDGLQFGIPQRYVVQPPAANSTVATVNGDPLSEKDVTTFLYQWYGQAAIQDLVYVQIVRQELKKDGLSLSVSDVDSRLQDDLKVAQKNMDANPQEGQAGRKIEDVLKDQGFPLSRLYLRAEIELGADKISLLSFKPAEYVRVSTLIIKAKDQTASGIDAAAKAANAIFKGLKAGGTWSAALKSSGAPQLVVTNNGYLGWRKISIFPETLQKTILNSQPNQYTDPVQLSGGFQIFRLELLGKNAQGENLQDLKNSFLSANRNQILEGIKSKAKTEMIWKGE